MECEPPELLPSIPPSVARGDDVLAVARRHDADRLDLVHGGVGGVEQPRRGVEPDGATDDAAQVALEVVHRAIILTARGAPRGPTRNSLARALRLSRAA